MYSISTKILVTVRLLLDVTLVVTRHKKSDNLGAMEEPLILESRLKLWPAKNLCRGRLLR